MRSRTDLWWGISRTSVLAGLFAFANGGPSPVAVAQSAPPPLVLFRGLIDQVSATPNGGLPSSSAQSGPRSISGDGRYVVFDSNAADLVPNDFNGTHDIFLRDRQMGTTTRVNVADDGSQALSGLSQGAAISTNGRHVAFASGAVNLVPGDTNGVRDVFVRDLDRGRTVRVSVATGGAQTDADSSSPAISADGRFVAFLSGASTLVPGAVLQPTQAYLHDRDADGNGVFDDPGGTATTLVSVSSTGGFADQYVEGLRVSADGRFVLFNSAAANIDPAGHAASVTHLYRRDRQTGQTSVIDRTAAGAGSNYGVYIRSADMSDDGRYMTYVSMSTDIEGLPGYGPAQVFRFDAAAAPGASTSVVSIRADGTAADGQSYATAISADGRYTAFSTTATNLATPATVPDGTALVIRDMAEGTLTRVDVTETGAAFDRGYVYPPAISADGSAVAFQSPAQNAPGGQYTWFANRVFVATAFAVTPLSSSFAMAGGAGSIEANTTAVSGWTAASLDPWIVLTEGDGFGAGPRTIQFSVSANDAGIVRDGRVRIGSTTVSIHQDGDGDVTPPVITPIVTGTLGGDGWYVGNVTVQWTIADPESPIVSQGYGCAGATIASDTISAPVTCEATSHGGSNTQTVVIRRDTTGPVITIFTPGPTLYTAGTTVTPAFSCSDPNGYSGVASCAISEGSTPLSTTAGWHAFAVTATDRAGNVATRRVEYFAGTGTCVPANVNLKAWWRFENDATDQLAAFSATPTPAGTLQFAPGASGRSWQSQSTTYLDTHDGERLLATDALTVAAWLKVTGVTGESATIVSKPAQYRIARYLDGTLRWAFNQNGVLAWVNTGVVIPGNAWTHVAVTYDHGLVKTYVNGRLAHALQLTGTLTVGPNPSASMTIGGRADLVASYFGWLDELQVAAAALSATEIEAIALAGSGTLCARGATTMTVSVPFSVGYGPPFTATATLRNSAGLPLAGKLVTIKSYVSPTGSYVGEASGTTDSAGQIHVPVPMSPAATVRVYDPGVIAQFTGDGRDASSTAMSTVLVLKGTPAITWPSPSPIVYGTALGGAQLNATANVAGTFAYSTPAGTVVDAGSRTIGVSFTPSDTDRWVAATASTTLVVNKAAPVVTITGGTFTYDKLPHPGLGRATGVLGEALGPVQVVYNDTSQTPPAGAGSNVVSASYAGSTNYTAGSAGNVPLVISKAVPVVTIAGGPFTYDGHGHPAAVTVSGVGGDSLSPSSVLYDGGSAAPVESGSHAVTVSYSGESNYEGATAGGTLVINKATPIMSLADVTVTYDGQPHGVAANVAGVNSDWLTPVIVTYNGSTTPPVDAGTYAIDARYDGSGNYNAISRTATLRILKAVPQLTWTTPASIVHGIPLGPAQLNATSTVPGSFSYTPGAGTVLSLGIHTLTASFAPADSANYDGASAGVALTVTKAPVTITWPAPAGIVYGTALSGAQLNATASVPGAFSYSPAPGTVLGAGSRPLSVAFTPDDAANYSSAEATVTLSVGKAAPTIVWPFLEAIVYGTPLGPGQLNAAADVPGTFSYSYGPTVFLGAGLRVISVTFTPADGANYSSASATRSLNVNQAPLTIAMNSMMKPYGAPLPPFSASAAGLVNFDTLASLAGALSFATPVTAGSAVGTYPVTPFGLSSPNYAIAFVAGTLTVIPGATAASLVASPNPSGVNQPVTLTATVSVMAGAGVPGGAVQFFDGGTLLGSVPLAAGTAALTTNGFVAGSHTLTVIYAGDASFANSSQASSLTVKPASTSSTTTVTSSSNPSSAGQSVTLTATISAPGASTGSVAFYDGAVLLGTMPVLSNDTARLTTSALASGGHAITARYLGNASTPPSVSLAFAQHVRPSGPNPRTSSVTVTASPSPATLGALVTLTATVTGTQGQRPTGTMVFLLNAAVMGEGTLTAFGTVTARAVLSTSTLAHGSHRVEVVYLGDATYRASTTSMTLVVN